MTSVPGSASTRSHSWLHITPLGQNSAASRAEQLGDALLQRADGGVLAVDVVADLGTRHGLAHLVGRPGDGVAAKVDRHGNRTSSSVQAELCRCMPSCG